MDFNFNFTISRSFLGLGLLHPFFRYSVLPPMGMRAPMGMLTTQDPGIVTLFMPLERFEFVFLLMRISSADIDRGISPDPTRPPKV